jgi:hypothetical protein
MEKDGISDTNILMEGEGELTTMLCSNFMF